MFIMQYVIKRELMTLFTVSHEIKETEHGEFCSIYFMIAKITLNPTHL